MRRLLPALLLLLPTVAAARQDSPPAEAPRTLSVEATASVDRPPQQAVLQLAVENQQGTAQQASQSNAEAMSRLVAALRRLDISGDHIRTTAYTLNPVYSNPGPGQPDRTPRITGYRALNMVQITVDSLPRLGAVIDAAVAAGANRIAGLSFQLRDSESPRLEALQAAVAKARRQAETVAQAAGQHLGPPLSIELNTSQPTPPPLYRAAALEAARSVETPVEAGALRVSVTVHIVYRLDGP